MAFRSGVLGGRSPQTKWERFTEDFVGVEAAEFFGEAVLEGASPHGDPLRGPSGLGQFRH